MTKKNNSSSCNARTSISTGLPARLGYGYESVPLRDRGTFYVPMQEQLTAILHQYNPESTAFSSVVKEKPQDLTPQIKPKNG
jgi:hypothetical protein